MNCNAVEPLLSQYIDGDLKDAQKKRVETHLSTCVHCRAEMEELCQVVKGVRELPSSTPPPGFAQRVMSRIREEEMKPAPLWERLFLPFHIKIPIQAIALVLVTVLATYLYRDNSLVQEEMEQMTSPSEIRSFRENSKLKEENQAPQATLRMEKDEFPPETVAPERVKKKRAASEPSLDQKKALIEKLETESSFRESSSPDSSSSETHKLTGRMMVMEKSTSSLQKQMLPIDDELLLLLNGPPERKTIREKIDLLLKNMGGDYFNPELASEHPEKEDASTEEVLWILLPELHLDRFKTGLRALGQLSEETPGTPGKITSQKKTPNSSLRIKLIVRPPAQ